MATSKPVRAGQFQPHNDDVEAVAQMAELRGNYQLNPRGQIYHLWFGERLADEHIRLFAAFPHLISFSAGVPFTDFTQFTNAGALELARFPRLCAVQLTNFSNLSNECVGPFLENKRIRWLMLNCPNIDNRILEHLPRMGHLITLDLSLSGVTTESLLALKQLTNLRRLILRKCGFSQKDITELAKALPKCTVVNEQTELNGRTVG